MNEEHAGVGNGDCADWACDVGVESAANACFVDSTLYEAIRDE